MKIVKDDIIQSKNSSSRLQKISKKIGEIRLHAMLFNSTKDCKLSVLLDWEEFGGKSSRLENSIAGKLRNSGNSGTDFF